MGYELREVRSGWAREGRRADLLQDLERLFQEQHPELNAVLHHGGPGLDAIRAGARDDPGWWVGPTVARLEPAAWAAFDVFWLHMRLFASHYATGHKTDDHLYALARLRENARAPG